MVCGGLKHDLASFQNAVFEHFSKFWEYFQTIVFVSFAHSSVPIAIDRQSWTLS
jgi:hypothetical protein